MNKRYISKTVRKKVLERDGYKCRICGSTEKLHLDHMTPFVDGGESTPENLQVLCQKCNAIKNSRALHELSYNVKHPILITKTASGSILEHYRKIYEVSGYEKTAFYILTPPMASLDTFE